MCKPLWKNKNIRFYVLAGCISRLGDALTGMAFLFLAYDLTGSNLLTTVMAAAETVPYLLFGLIGGVTADWMQKKKWLIQLDIIRVPIVLSVVVLSSIGWLTFTYLLTASFLLQSIGCFFNPAHRSVLPLITDENERISVNSLYDSLTRGITILSPVVSIWLLNTYGAVHFFTVDALTYVTSALFLYQVTIKEKEHAVQKSLTGMVEAIKEFADWTRTQPVIRRLFLFTFITVFFNTWVWEVGLLLALAEMSGRSEELYSMLQGVFGGVVILTNTVLPLFFKKLTFSHYLIGALIWGTGIFYYGIFFNVPHFFIGCAIVGIGLPLAGLTRIYILQSLIPEEKMGRAFSLNAVLLYLANTISLAVYGTLASFLSIQYLMIGSGSVMVLVSMISLLIYTVDTAKFGRRFLINFFK
ncbi:MFS transporter [Halobacillus sp. A5]|uniref:MFS transporter n=1 Tax=Halobacillus sp. A5 TaxID=2880263 RepID=UPI0020A68471|nr:MFS transporter [Halobacillus sp. A5]MCP3026541.1 MFS transporter [Halobacillus sp. A5]